MKCIISGNETNFKWNNNPICRDYVQMAKDYVKDHPKYSQRQALALLAREFKQDMQARAKEAKKKYEENKTLEERNEDATEEIMSMIKATFKQPQVIKGNRVKRELSIQEISTKVGIDESVLDDFENGKKEPSDDEAIKIAEFYGVTRTSVKGIVEETRKITEKEDTNESKLTEG